MKTIKSSAGSGKYYWDYKEFCFLVEIMHQAKDFKETLNLFMDLHTHQEIAEITRRVIIASYLNDGRSYEEIIDITGASAGTISKISQKMARQKSILNAKLAGMPDFDKFSKDWGKKESNFHDLISNSINKHTMGLFR